MVSESRKTMHLQQLEVSGIAVRVPVFRPPVVGDNLRTGAALNAVQIAEIL